MQLTYKFRFYPTKKQEQKLLWVLDRCRFVYNYLLEQKTKQNLPKNRLQALLPNLKKQYPDLENIYSKVLQYENYRLHSNIMALHRLKEKGRKIGKLRFKGKGWFKTFVYNQSGFKIIEQNRRYNLLHLSRIGDIPFLMHREIKGDIKQVVIKHQLSGKWFISIIAEIKAKPNKPTHNKMVAIDLGLDNFVYDSDRNRINHPKYLNISLERLKRQQRRLSQKKKGSSNRERQRSKLARVYEKVTNQRDDFLHKLSRHYVNTYTFIAHEDLNIKGMVRNSYLARSIMDASWLRFIRMLEYKAESAGVQVIKVEAKDTTQRCSQCGKLVKKTIAVRLHKCPYCGLQIHRDYNSALNILNKALGQGLSESTPVEMESLPPIKSGQILS